MIYPSQHLVFKILLIDRLQVCRMLRRSVNQMIQALLAVFSGFLFSLWIF